MLTRKRPGEGRVISKTEDKTWLDWYNKLTPADHDQMLQKLGLDEEDREEFKEDLKTEKVKPKTSKK